ncbi:MAG: hypothetical protein COV67_14450 [Nitrospinae bacterium CG11_big_fil_rev_8_21_14_0_20_56_8]|nr:MAG: hypothetical protein COV67_14450 [Nitrospinae bacterium CG11_big_fil_rev_8_21_14_0_20_56_8]
MIGAIAGDIIGSVYEWRNVKTRDFPLFCPESTFTDDTVLTVAVADCLLSGADYVSRFKDYYTLYPDAGYGQSFSLWAQSPARDPYNSWGNGSAMRVSPVGFAFDTLEEVLDEARKTAEATHNHPEGVKGAQATAAAVFLARKGKTKEQIQSYIETTFHYSLQDSLDSIRPGYTFDVSCQGTVPPALRAFLESADYEDAVRLAISIGGDSDTLACIAGGVAHAYYRRIPDAIVQRVYRTLDGRLKNILENFMERFPLPA